MTLFLTTWEGLVITVTFLVFALFVSAMIFGKVAPNRLKRGRTRNDLMYAEHLRMKAEREAKFIASRTEPPLPAWATEPLDLETEPLTHESAWSARETLRRLDPARAMRLDEILPLEPPPAPAKGKPAPPKGPGSGSTRGEVVFRPGIADRPLVHEHPARVRLEQIVGEVGEFAAGYPRDPSATVTIAREQADHVRSLLKEGEALKCLLQEEADAVREARELDEVEKREEHARRSLADLAVWSMDIEAQAARRGMGLALRQAREQVAHDVRRHEATLKQCEVRRKMLLLNAARRSDYDD